MSEQDSKENLNESEHNSTENISTKTSAETTEKTESEQEIVSEKNLENACANSETITSGDENKLKLKKESIKDKTPNCDNEKNTSIDINDTLNSVPKQETVPDITENKKNIEQRNCQQDAAIDETFTIPMNIRKNSEMETKNADETESYFDVSDTNEIKVEPCQIEDSDYCNNPLPKRTPSPRKRKESISKTPESTRKRRNPRKSSSEDRSLASLKKRKVSINSENEYFSDTIKSELGDMETISDYEAIDMLHDLDNIINFEDCRISTDILLSSLSCDIMQEADGSDAEMNKDPVSDPLFIGNCNNEIVSPSKKSADTGHSTYKKKGKTAKRKSPKQRLRNKESNGDPLCIGKNSNKIVSPCKEAKYKDTESSSYKRKAETLAKRKFPKQNNGVTKDKENQSYLSENEEEDEEDEVDEIETKISPEVISKLQNLQVKLIHDVPPQHKIETRAGSRPPKLQEKRSFEKYGPLRKGIFSPVEDEIIQRNWNMFCKVHDWDPTNAGPFLYMRHKYKYYITNLENRLKFVQFLANGLPWRTLYSVYYRFRNLYHKRRRNRFSPEEDEKIVKYIKNHAHNASYPELARKLRRSSRSVWLRHQIIKKSNETSSKKKKLQKTVKWTLSSIRRFIKTLMVVTLSETVEELKDAIILKVVWQKLEEKLEIDQNILKTFWLQQLHMQLFCEGPIYLNDVKIKLIEYMYGKGISHTREIIWPNVAKYFEGMTTLFLCKLFYLMIRDTGMSTSKHNLADIIEYLYNEKIPEIRENPMDKQLPRLKYTNGELTIIEEDMSNNDIVTNNIDISMDV